MRGNTYSNSVGIKAYGVLDSSTPLHEMDIIRRQLRPDDVKIDILYCGICHSDYHHIKNNWGDSKYPMVPGHEIIGIVSQIGNGVTKYKIGDTVAVGNMVDSCGQCQMCNMGQEQVCQNGQPSWTYNGNERYVDGVRTLFPVGALTFGGYSQQIICKESFVLNVPNNLQLDRAAPLLCAGTAVYWPLKYLGVGPGTVLGVAGIGGLGHLGIKLAKALGATVIAITTTPWKVEDAVRLGADDAFLITDDMKKFEYKDKIDIILNTIPVPHDITPYVEMIKPGGAGKLHILGNFDMFPPISGLKTFFFNKNITGSNVLGIADTQEMLDFCSMNNILADIQLVNIQDVNESIESMRRNEVKYRYVIDMSTL